jgi:formylglycine-generating enzyme required for sulfatase activity
MKLTFFLLSVAALAAQTTVRVDVNLQQVRFRLTDGAKAVSTMRPTDFSVEENGVPHAIANLIHQVDTPVSFAVVVDTRFHEVRSLTGQWTGGDVTRFVVSALLSQMKPQDELTLWADTSTSPILTLTDLEGRAEELERAAQNIPRTSMQNPGNMLTALTGALSALRTSKHRSRAVITVGMEPWNLGRGPKGLDPEVLDKVTGYEREIPFYSVDTTGESLSPTLRPSITGPGFSSERNYEFWVNPFVENTGGRAFRFDLNSLNSPRVQSRLNTYIEQMNLDLRSYYVLGYYSTVPQAVTRRVHLQPLSADYRVNILRSPLQLEAVGNPAATAVFSRSSEATTSKVPVFRDQDFVLIAPGQFLMGCDPADPSCYPTDFGYRVGDLPSPNSARRKPWSVRISRAFEIGRHEVSQAEWESVMGTNPSYFRGPNRPVERVSWRDVQEFLKRMNARRDGYRYRLPSEEEWEYVARSGKSGFYEGSLDPVAWYVENSEMQTHARGGKEPNAWGMHDMYGNVFEWLADSNPDQPVDFTTIGAGLSLLSGPSTRRIRGGSWFSASVFSRTSYRMGMTEEARLSTLGFRLVRERD